MSSPRDASLSIAATALVLCMVAASSARADRCCYAMCKVLTHRTLGLHVTCVDEDDDCPRTVGTCMVWAHKDTGVRCATPRACPVGVHGDLDAEKIVTRLADDPTLVVTEPAAFSLSTGVVVSFEPRP